MRHDRERFNGAMERTEIRVHIDKPATAELPYEDVDYIFRKAKQAIEIESALANRIVDIDNRIEEILGTKYEYGDEQRLEILRKEVFGIEMTLEIIRKIKMEEII